MKYKMLRTDTADSLIGVLSEVYKILTVALSIC